MRTDQNQKLFHQSAYTTQISTANGIVLLKIPDFHSLEKKFSEVRKNPQSLERWENFTEQSHSTFRLCYSVCLSWFNGFIR